MDAKQRLIGEIKKELIDNTMRERIAEMIEEVRRDLVSQVQSDLDTALLEMSVDQLRNYLESLRASETVAPQTSAAAASPLSLKDKLKGRG